MPTRRRSRPVRAPGRRGRPALLDRDRILEAARGIDPRELSMPALAEALGVSTQALYYYFPNRESLLEALADSVLAEIPPVVDRGQGWQAWAREIALTTRRVLLATPGAAERIRAGVHPVAALRHLDRAIGVLTAAGFSDADALRVYALLTDFVVRSCAADARRGRRRRALSAECESVIERRGAEELPHLSRLVDAGVAFDGQAAFERNLDDLLAGFEAGLARSGRDA